jgi:riboflavin synthase
MFTGLVQDIGHVVFKSKNNEGYILGISSPALIPDLKVDDSIAVNGVCQTVTSIKGSCFYVQAVQITLDKTTLGSLSKKDEVNLELAMKLGDRLGGHIVQGHSNGKSLIKKIVKLGNNYILTIRITEEIAPYITQEGSISIDGISLTIASLREEEKEFSVSVIPHTWGNTILKNKKIGDEINIEVDILAKYIERLLFFKKNKCSNSTKTPITEEWLRSKGF